AAAPPPAPALRQHHRRGPADPDRRAALHQYVGAAGQLPVHLRFPAESGPRRDRVLALADGGTRREGQQHQQQALSAARLLTALSVIGGYLVCDWFTTEALR